MHNTALQIAKYIIDFCTRCGNPISNLQLQKILYYIQLNFYRNFQYLAFEDEIQAWSYGPVVPEVYHHFCSFGATRICSLYESERNIFSREEENLVNRVINVCSSLEPWELVERSHQIGSPWARVYHGKAIDIPVEYIMEYATKM